MRRPRASPSKHHVDSALQPKPCCRLGGVIVRIAACNPQNLGRATDNNVHTPYHYIIRGKRGYTHSLSPSRPPNNTLNAKQQRTQVQGHISHTHARADRRVPQMLRVCSGRGRHYSPHSIDTRPHTTEESAPF
eukprot:scaffold27180_cov64-Phaeocystis_antarctica.AAC.3